MYREKNSDNRIFILGIDLGYSIGTSYIMIDPDDPLSFEIERLTSRVISVGDNRKRSASRHQRRQLSRRKMRRTTLTNLLIKNGLIPENEDEMNLLYRIDPYDLRSRGLDEKLTLFEFGRALLHLSKRRGFQSNAKKPVTLEEEKESSDFKKRMQETERYMNLSKSRTIGEFLNKQSKKRGCYTLRSWYLEELCMLWKSQQRFHSDILTDSLQDAVKKVIFDQRPLKTQRFLVGKCSLEINKPRCNINRPEAQIFNMLCDINNLRVTNDENIQHLRPVHREKIFRYLTTEKPEISWTKIKSITGLPSTVSFNLEKTKKKLQGSKTEHVFKNCKDRFWNELSDEDRSQFLEDVFSTTNESTLIRCLKEKWSLSGVDIEAICEVAFDSSGYSSLSLKAIRKITPHLERGLSLEKGSSYFKACRDAGYSEKKARKIVCLDYLPNPPKVSNPAVSKILHELKKIINAHIRHYGVKPEIICLETANSPIISSRQKEAVMFNNEKNKRHRDEAEEYLKRNNKSINETNILKYRMWKEQREICVYSGKPISIHQLVSSEIQIDHILHLSRSYDDSFDNKVVCFRDENLSKNDRTPREWCGTTRKYDEILSRTKCLSKQKQEKFLVSDIQAQKARHLNDTRYIISVVREWLKTIGVKIICVNGDTTARVRRHLGLDYILSDSEEKNRNDHRHHAIDAFVVSVEPFISSAIDNISSVDIRRVRRKVQDAIDDVIVSHSPTRKIRGELHNETAYSKKRINGQSVFGHRVPVDDALKKNQKRMQKIRDGGDFSAIQNRETDEEIYKGSNKILNVTINEPVSEKSMRQIHKKYQGGYYKLYSNYCANIYRNSKNDVWEMEIVSLYEASQKTYTYRNQRFVMSLCVNDMIRLNDEIYRVVSLMKSMKGRKGVEDKIRIVPHHLLPRYKDEKGKISEKNRKDRSSEQLMKSGCEKVDVDHLGIVRKIHG